MNLSNNKSPPDQLERRIESRHKSYLTATLSQNKKNSFATVVNLSSQGLGILAGEPFKKGDSFEVALTQMKTNRIKVRINVQTCHEKDGKYYVGTKIINVKSNKAQLYKEIVSSHRPSIIQ